jgi:hypothetical protein
MKKKNPFKVTVPAFARAFRTSPAALLVVEKTTRSYESGDLPHFAKLLVAYPALYEALGVDVRRMSAAERQELCRSLERRGEHR